MYRDFVRVIRCNMRIRTFLLHIPVCMYSVVFTVEELKAVTTGSFFGAHRHAAVFKERPEHCYFNHKASSGNQETGGTPLLPCLALFAGCWECCPSALPQKIAVYHQLQTGFRLSTGEVTLVRNTAATPCSRS